MILIATYHVIYLKTVELIWIEKISAIIEHFGPKKFAGRILHVCHLFLDVCNHGLVYQLWTIPLADSGKLGKLSGMGVIPGKP